MKKEDKKMKQMQGKRCRPVLSYSFNVDPCSLSLKGVGDQVAWVDFKGKEEIGVVGLFCKTHIHCIMQLKS